MQGESQVGLSFLALEHIDLGGVGEPSQPGGRVFANPREQLANALVIVARF